MEHVFDRITGRRYRSDVSLLSELVGLLSSQRATGVPVRADELPIVQGIGSLIADTLAAMPLYAVDEVTGQRVARRFPVLDQPNPDEDRGTTVHKIAQAMFHTGNGHAVKGPTSGGLVDSITVVDPNAVAADIDALDPLRVRGWELYGRPVARSRVVHWKLNDDPRRGPLGESPLKRCTAALDTYGWAYAWLADFYRLGGNPGAVFKTSLELSTTKKTALIDEWVRARRQHRPPVIEKWLDYEVPPASDTVAQTVAVLEFATAEVARMLNMPVSLVNAPVAGYSLQYSNVGDEFRRWLAVSLGTTWVQRLEAGFSTLLPDGYRARLDPSELFRSDLFPEQANAGAPVELGA
jgi:HK97 family phage portal protein